MSQPFAESDTVTLLISGRPYVRLHSPAPRESWERADLWELLADRCRGDESPAISVECGADDAVWVYAAAKGLGLRWRLRPADWKGDPQEEHAVEIHALDGQPVGQSLLGALALGRVQSALSRALEDPAAGVILGERYGAVQQRRPGRRGHPDLWYAVPAQRYVRALQESPRAPYVFLVEEDALNGKHSTVDEWKALIRRARDSNRGLLTPAQPGVAAGELTDKAKALLRSVGLLKED
jgi:hypothetical protein